MHIYVCIYTNMCVYMCAYIYICMYIYIYIHIQIIFPKLFILVVQGLCCCAQALVVESRSFLFAAKSGLLIAVVSLVQHKL